MIRSRISTLIGFIGVVLLTSQAGLAITTELAWDAPTNNVDGTPITDIAGYKVYYGTSSGNYTEILDVPSGTSCTVPDLTEGTTYYFSAKTVNTGDLLSDLSDELVWIAPDETPPVIPELDPVTLNAGVNGNAAVPDFLEGIAVSDNVSDIGDMALDQNPDAGTLVVLGLTVVTVTATDAAGNSAMGTVNFTVVDTTAPVMVAPEPITLIADLEDNAVMPDLRNVIVSDNCSPVASILVFQTPTPGTSVTLGSKIITLTATDEAGNSSECLVALTVNPCNRAPVVSAGDAATITLPSAIATLNGSFTDDGLPTGGSAVATWSTESGPAAVSFGDIHAIASTATFSEAGTYVLTLTVSDGELSTNANVTITVLARPRPNPPERLRVVSL